MFFLLHAQAISLINVSKKILPYPCSYWQLALTCSSAYKLSILCCRMQTYICTRTITIVGQADLQNSGRVIKSTLYVVITIMLIGLDLAILLKILIKELVFEINKYIYKMFLFLIYSIPSNYSIIFEGVLYVKIPKCPI